MPRSEAVDVPIRGTPAIQTENTPADIMPGDTSD